MAACAIHWREAHEVFARRITDFPDGWAPEEWAAASEQSPSMKKHAGGVLAERRRIYVYSK